MAKARIYLVHFGLNPDVVIVEGTVNATRITGTFDEKTKKWKKTDIPTIDIINDKTGQIYVEFLLTYDELEKIRKQIERIFKEKEG